jgi:hypothetical protein
LLHEKLIIICLNFAVAINRNDENSLNDLMGAVAHNKEEAYFLFIKNMLYASVLAFGKAIVNFFKEQKK